MYDRIFFRSAQNVTDVSFFVVTIVVAHEGLASLAVDLHEVGDLLALTNSLVQLHNLCRRLPSDT